MKNSEYLKSKGIEALWHFTHADNIPQIEGSGALCSKKALDELGILEEVTFVSNCQSRDADRRTGSWDMISLSLTRITPMFEEKFNKDVPMRMYKVFLTVADFPGVVFTDTNATYPMHRRYSTPEYIQFDLLRESGRRWDRFYARQAEVLVPYRIPTKYITTHWDLAPTSLGYRRACRANSSFQEPKISPPNFILHDRFRGAMTLSAIGDALGWPTEFLKENAAHKSHFAIPIREFVSWSKSVGGRWWGYDIEIKPGEYSDDTQLNLAVARSISLDGDFDPQHFAHAELPLWLEYERGGGRAVKAAAKSLAGKSRAWNTNFYKMGNSDYHQAGGNGAVMRNVPIALVNIYNTDRLVRDSIINSIITHGHPRGILGTVIMASAIVHALGDKKFDEHHVIGAANECLGLATEKFENDDLLREWVHNWETTRRASGHRFLDLLARVKKETNAHLDAIPEHLKRDPKHYYRLVGALDPKTKGSGTGTACVALFLALKGENAPEESMITAVNQLGSDTDTIASCLGALLGARIGFREICPSWRDCIEDGKYIRDTADRICRIAIGRTPLYITELLGRAEAEAERKEWSDRLHDLLIAPTTKKIQHPTMGTGVVEERMELDTAKKGSIMRLARVRFGCAQSCIFRERSSE